MISQTDFWSRVARVGDCLEWQMALNDSGYGRITIDGFTYRAHRVAYELANGPIPDGMIVCHSCDNPACVNPEHLWLGTKKDNTQDMLQKGRHHNGVRPKGCDHHAAKLDEEDVVWIRELAHLGLPALSRLFDVTRQAIWAIINRRTWRHIP